MDEGDLLAATAAPRLPVDQLGTLRLEVGQGGVDIGDGKRDVVQTLATPLEEAADRGIGSERLQQLHEGPTDRDHRLFHSLVVHHLAVQRLDPIEPSVVLQRAVEIVAPRFAT